MKIDLTKMVKKGIIPVIDKTYLYLNGKVHVEDLNARFVINYKMDQPDGVYLNIIKGGEIEDFPVERDGEIVEGKTFEVKWLIPELKRLAKFCGDDKLFPIFCGIHFGKFMAATDKHVLTITEEPVFEEGITIDVRPYMTRLEYLVNFFGAKHLGIRQIVQRNEQDPKIVMNRYIEFYCDYFSLMIKEIEGKYPDVYSILPETKSNPTRVVIPNFKDVLKEIQTASKQINSTMLKSIGVDFDKKLIFSQDIGYGYIKSYPIEVTTQEPSSNLNLMMPFISDNHAGFNIEKLAKWDNPILYFGEPARAILIEYGAKLKPEPKPEPEKKPEQKPVQKPEQKTEPESAPNIRVVQYSEKAFAIFGDTKQIKDQLKEIGAGFNRYLTLDGEKVPGWVISRKKEAMLASVLNQNIPA